MALSWGCGAGIRGKCSLSAVVKLAAGGGLFVIQNGVNVS